MLGPTDAAADGAAAVAAFEGELVAELPVHAASAAAALLNPATLRKPRRLIRDPPAC
jgi:hypothetical protein